MDRREPKTEPTTVLHTPKTIPGHFQAPHQANSSRDLELIRFRFDLFRTLMNIGVYFLFPFWKDMVGLTPQDRIGNDVSGQLDLNAFFLC